MCPISPQAIKYEDVEEIRVLGSVFPGYWGGGLRCRNKRINARCFAGKPSEREQLVNHLQSFSFNLDLAPIHNCFYPDLYIYITLLPLETIFLLLMILTPF